MTPKASSTSGTRAHVLGRAEEFELLWPVHLQEAVDNVTGFAAAQRYRLMSVLPWSVSAAHSRLVIYELEGDDVGAIHRDNIRVRESGIYTPFNHLIRGQFLGHVYSPVGQNAVAAARDERETGCPPVILVLRDSPAPGSGGAVDAWLEKRPLSAGNVNYRHAGVRRYRLNAAQRPGMIPSRWQCITICAYTQSELDLPSALADKRGARTTGLIPPEDLVSGPAAGHVFAAVGSRITPTR